MNDRSLALPAQLLRRLVTPATLGVAAGLVGALLSRVLRRARAPALPRMSDEWLRSHDHDTGRSADHWRDSW